MILQRWGLLLLSSLTIHPTQDEHMDERQVKRQYWDIKEIVTSMDTYFVLVVLLVFGTTC